MRCFTLIFIILASSAAHAAPTGAWVCRYKDPNQKQTVRLDFAAGRLSVDRGIGAVPMKNAVIADDRVSWKDGMTFEFFPSEKRMTRTSATGTDGLVCVRE